MKGLLCKTPFGSVLFRPFGTDKYFVWASGKWISLVGNYQHHFDEQNVYKVEAKI